MDIKQVINGKLYNTETATLVKDYEFSNPGDFHYLYQGLYKTAKGAWFTAGHGGPMSTYSEYIGNGSTSGGSGINPLTPDEALIWLEEHDGTDEILEHFAGAVEEA